MILIPPPLILPFELEAEFRARGYRSTYKSCGQAVLYSRIGMPHFLPPNHDLTAHIYEILDRCLGGFVVVDNSQPLAVLEYAKTHDVDLTFVRPPISAAVSALVQMGWGFPFRDYPDIHPRIVQGYMRPSDDSVVACYEGYRRLWTDLYSGIADRGLIDLVPDQTDLRTLHRVREIMDRKGLLDAWF